MKNLTISVLLVLLFIQPILAQSVNEVADFYVATNGNDRWSGKLEMPNTDKSDGPFATIERARDAVREIKNTTSEDITVFIRGGKYYLKETVEFGIDDAAKADQIIRYMAYPGEEPVFSSGVKIGGWQQYRERGWKTHEFDVSELPEMAKAKVWVADVPEELGSFRTLYDGNKRLPRSRSQAYVVDDPDGSIKDPHREFKYAEGTIKNWSNFSDVELIVRRMHFTITILSLESIDQENLTARTDIHNYGTLHTVTNERPQAIMEGEPAIWIENTLEDLDNPGEWVLDSKNRKLYFWPYGDDHRRGNICSMPN